MTKVKSASQGQTPEKSLKEKIADWKKQYGVVLKLTAEDGKVAYLRDPVNDLEVMKLAFSAASKSSIAFVQCIISNCFLGGDHEILHEEKYGNGLENQVHEIVVIPDSRVDRIGNKWRITCEGYSIEVRTALRNDITMAEQKNAAREPYETNIQLLKIIALNESELKVLMQNTRAMIGVLAALDKVKDKAKMLVEKL